MPAAVTCAAPRTCVATIGLLDIDPEVVDVGSTWPRRLDRNR